MNPDLKVLRVAVVPTETGNGIDQSSSVEQILACEETQLYSVFDYFQAQNDEDLPILHWSFLINIEDNTIWNGMNTDGIDYHSNRVGDMIEADLNRITKKIDYIKKVLGDWGSTSCAELQRDHSPCKTSIGNGKNNISELIEQFEVSGVSSVVYNDEIEIGWNDYSYDELEEYLIDEIVEIMEEYEADQIRTEKRCKD